jgi:hypothetical protein
VRQLRTELEAQRGDYTSTSDELTFGEWCDRFLEGRRPDIREGTFDSYKSAIETYVKPILGAKRLSTITVADLERLKIDLLEHIPPAVTNMRAHRLACAYGGTESAWRAKLKDQPVGASTVGKALTLIAMVFNDAIRHQAVTFNPATHVRRGKGQAAYFQPIDTREVLTRSELEKLIDRAPSGFGW